jgi:hypothetical protein
MIKRVALQVWSSNNAGGDVKLTGDELVLL